MPFTRNGTPLRYIPTVDGHVLPTTEEVKTMFSIFPGPIKNLPEAEIPIDGISAFLSQSGTHQIIFMEFQKNVDLPEHSHAAQVGFVIEGEIELTINGECKTYRKGDRYYIPEGVSHSGKIFAGYADITFFDDPKRYSPK